MFSICGLPYVRLFWWIVIDYKVYETKCAHQIGAYLQAQWHKVTRSISIPPLDGMLVWYPFIHLGGERHWENEVCYPGTEHNAQPGFIHTAGSKDKHTSLLP